MLWSYSYEESKIFKLTEAESRMAVARHQDGEGKRERLLQSKGTKF